MIIIFDFISLLPIVIYFSLLYNFLINPVKNLIDLFLFIYILSADYLVKIIKNLDYPPKMYQITRRPEGACNTDYLSRNGIVNKDTPGFPSGHVTSITIFSIFMMLIKWQFKIPLSEFIFSNKRFVLIHIFLIVITGIARYIKKCHNLFQIIGGFCFGSFMAVIFYFLMKLFLVL
jgi:membrane-associated phospholipid phosphatase